MAKVKFFYLLSLFLLARQPALSQQWTVGNDLISRTISLSPETGLRTASLLYKPTGRNLVMGTAGDEFGFDANDHRYTGKSFTFVKAIPTENQLELQLASKDKALKVSVFYAVFKGHAAIRKWISVTNVSAAPLYLKRFRFESINASPGPASETELLAAYGAQPQARFFTGRVSDGCLIQRNTITGEGLAIINEAPGYLKRTEVGSGWQYGTQVMYDTDLFPFGRTIQPNETFESAKSSLVLFQDNKGFADPKWALPRYVSEVIARRHGKAQPIWLYNTWEPFHRNVSQSLLEQLSPAAGAMGIDTFTIDDGWQTEYGANEVDRKNFPDGMPGIKKVLDRDHLKLGLWVPLAAISTKTSEYRDHPEWACRDTTGKPKLTNTASGQQAVMCLGSGYRDAALTRLDKLISTHHPSYIKVDLTTAFNTYGEAPGCYATNHHHRDLPESLERIYEAMQYIGAELYKRHPEVMVDYTFELWGEKHLIDAGLLGAADLDWLSNIQDKSTEFGGPLQARTLLYNRAPSIPAETMLIGNLHADTAPIEERFAVAIGSGPVFLGDLRNLNANDQHWYQEKIEWFKKLRAGSNLQESFFPLGSWTHPNASEIDGFARLSRDHDGIIVLCKNQSKSASLDVKLIAPAGARYQARSIISGQSLGAVDAQKLTNGLVVQLPSNHPTEIIELQRLP